MIVLSGGKKVFPEEVETVMQQSDNFAEVCVVGVSRSFGAKDGTEDIGAVIVPKESLINQYDSETLDKLVKDEVKTQLLKLEDIAPEIYNEAKKQKKWNKKH